MIKIENGTVYSNKLESLNDCQPESIRNISKEIISEYDDETRQKIFESLEYGNGLLEREEQLAMFIYSFYRMYFERFNLAFERRNQFSGNLKLYFEHENIEIIDYGCGQGLAEIYLSTRYKEKIKSVTLIEPSLKALQRAGLHTSTCLPKAKLTMVNKYMDDLSSKDIITSTENLKVHILSNFTELEMWDMQKFADFIGKKFKGYNLVICTGLFNKNIREKTQRIDNFSFLLLKKGGKLIAKSYFEQGNGDTKFSCQLSVFGYATNLSQKDLLWYNEIEQKHLKRFGNKIYSKKDNKVGLLEINGDVFLPYLYDSIVWQQDANVFIIERANKAGLYDVTGKELVPLEYDEIDGYLDKGFFQVTKDRKKGLIDRAGNQHIPVIYDLLEAVTDEKFEYGIDPIFDEIDRCIVSYGKNGCLGIDGYIIIKDNGYIVNLKKKYDHCEEFKNHFAIVSQFGKYGCVENKLVELDPDADYENVFTDRYDAFEIIPCEYDYINIGEKYIILKKDNLSGFYSITEKKIFPCIYEDIIPTKNKELAVKSDLQWGFVGPDNNIIIPFKYELVKNFSEGLAAVKINSKWGCINANDEMIILPIYEVIKEFSEGLAVSKLNALWGCIDFNGKTIFNFCFYSIGPFQNGLSTAIYIENTGRSKLEHTILISRNGHFLSKKIENNVITYGGRKEEIKWINGNFDFIGNFGFEKSAKVIKDGKSGYVDLEGNVIIECKYDHIDLNGNIAIVRLRDKYGCVNLNGEVIIPVNSDIMHWESTGRNIIRIDDERNRVCESGLTTMNNGKTHVIPNHYSSVKPFKCGFAAVRRNKKWGFINEQNQEIIPCIYERVQDFFLAAIRLDGNHYSVGDKTYHQHDEQLKKCILSAAKLNGKWGVINTTGVLQIACKYTHCDISSANIYVERNDILDGSEGGYINQNGELLVCGGRIPSKYDWGYDFWEGYANVQLNGKQGLIDVSGKEVISCEYDYCHDFFSCDLIPVGRNGKFGFVNLDGEEVVPCRYDSLSIFENGQANVVENGIEFTINNEGKKI